MDWDKLSELVPELGEWNSGAGITLDQWFDHIARSDHALAYLTFFWPSFVLIDEGIFRIGTTPLDVKHWKDSLGDDVAAIERVLNHVHLDDIFNDESNDDHVVHRKSILGQALREIYETKLRQDFPDRGFELYLEYEEESENDLVFTFCQKKT